MATLSDPKLDFQQQFFNHIQNQPQPDQHNDDVRQKAEALRQQQQEESEALNHYQHHQHGYQNFYDPAYNNHQQESEYFNNFQSQQKHLGDCHEVVNHPSYSPKGLIVDTISNGTGPDRWSGLVQRHPHLEYLPPLIPINRKASNSAVDLTTSSQNKNDYQTSTPEKIPLGPPPPYTSPAHHRSSDVVRGYYSRVLHTNEPHQHPPIHRSFADQQLWNQPSRHLNYYGQYSNHGGMIRRECSSTPWPSSKPQNYQCSIQNYQFQDCEEKYPQHLVDQASKFSPHQDATEKWKKLSELPKNNPPNRKTQKHNQKSTEKNFNKEKSTIENGEANTSSAAEFIRSWTPHGSDKVFQFESGKETRYLLVVANAEKSESLCGQTIERIENKFACARSSGNEAEEEKSAETEKVADEDDVCFTYIGSPDDETLTRKAKNEDGPQKEISENYTSHISNGLRHAATLSTSRLANSHNQKS